MVRHREPRGQGEWAGAGRLVRPAPVSTVRSGRLLNRAALSPLPLTVDLLGAARADHKSQDG